MKEVFSKNFIIDGLREILLQKQYEINALQKTISEKENKVHDKVGEEHPDVDDVMKENDVDVHYNNMNLDQVVENICNQVHSHDEIAEEPTLSGMKVRCKKNRKGKDKDRDRTVTKKSKNNVQDPIMVDDGREEVQQSSGESAQTKDLMESPLFNRLSKPVVMFFATCSRKDVAFGSGI